MIQRKARFQISGCLLALLLPAWAYAALNLGDINLKSAPGQPLDAEIQVSGIAADEINSMSVGLADVAGFRWAGIPWSPALNQLQFELKRGADGTDYIRIHSNEVVRTTLLHFLLKVAWHRGRLFREYTLELDVPLQIADARSEHAAAAAVAVPAIERDWDEIRARVQANRNYGPVVRFDTLWSLARELRPDSSVSVQQMMLALLRTNPDAFHHGNINWLKKGAVLWLPNDFELQALLASEAYAEVQAQNNFWREARGYSTVATGLQTGSGTVAVDGGLRLVAVSDEDLEDAEATVVDPDGAAQAEVPALANEQIDELSQDKTELEDKLTEADALVEGVRRPVELKDDELAALQRQLLDEQVGPGPGLVERFKSFLDSALSLAGDYWQVAFAGLLGLFILVGGWSFLLREPAPGDRGLAIPAASIRTDNFVRVVSGGKAGGGKYRQDARAEDDAGNKGTLPAGTDGNERKDAGLEDEVQNKLELARAYLKLDDVENVRSILNEVLAEGNDAQREAARQLLDQI